MTIVLSVLGVALVAFCIWLAVRIVNRRERWAKWTAAGIFIALPVLYVGSFGPACWIVAADGRHPAALPILYLPIGWAFSISTPFNDAMHAYALLGMQPDTRVMIPIDPDGYVPIMRK